MRMFDMSNHSHLFRTRPQLEAEGFHLWGNKIVKKEPLPNGEWRLEKMWLPLYEGKMFMPFDHRYANVVITDNPLRAGQPEFAQYSDHINPNFTNEPRYWVDLNEVLRIKTDSYFLGFKNVTSGTNERTFLATILPKSAIGHSTPIIFVNKETLLKSAFLGNCNSISFDYFARQKLGGINLTYGYVQQFPVIPTIDSTDAILVEITPKLIELIYSSWDIKSFADDVWKEADEDLKAAIREQWEENKAATGGHEWDPPEWCEIDPEGCPLPPFKWDEERRAILKAELDAIYARLYGLNRKQLRYILDPADLTPRELENILDPWEEVTNPLDPEGYAHRSAQSTFPGETFRVLKEKDIRQFGEYRTRRLVLEAWERQNKS
mgnify:FL=1